MSLLLQFHFDKTNTKTHLLCLLPQLHLLLYLLFHFSHSFCFLHYLHLPSHNYIWTYFLAILLLTNSKIHNQYDLGILLIHLLYHKHGLEYLQVLWFLLLKSFCHILFWLYLQPLNCYDLHNIRQAILLLFLC